jgi:hypothetical protein
LQVLLFNLDDDVGEVNDESSTHPEIVKKLEAMMSESWQEPGR